MNPHRTPKRPRQAAPDNFPSELQRLIESQSAQLELLTSRLESLTTVSACCEEFMQRTEEMEQSLFEVRKQQLIAQLGKPKADKQISYLEMIRRIRETVRTSVPREATVAVISKGDDQLLQLFGRRAWHFPQDAEGQYSGFYPSSSLSAIAQLEALRAKGADHLLIPATAFWWRDIYSDFYRHVERRYSEVARDGETCTLFALRQPGPWLPMEEAVAECRVRLSHEPVILDWQTERGLAKVFSDCTIFSPPQSLSTLPYLDSTIDLVAVNGSDEAATAEARRVASKAVLEFRSEPDQKFELSVRWRSEAATSRLPAASIIVAGCSDSVVTDRCLAAILETLPPSTRAEIIVVYEAAQRSAADGLIPFHQKPRQVKVLTSPASGGFLKAAACGARAGRGEVLVFIGCDALPLPGWLPPLLQMFSRHKDAGVVGGRLLRPDGRLYEAGGILGSNGSPTRFGDGDVHAEAPHYRYVRPVDFCSGAFLATRRSLFRESGGFAGALTGQHGYEVDYCQKLGEKGWRAYYQPNSSAVYFGSDTKEPNPCPK